MNAEHLRELREKAGIVVYDVNMVRVVHLRALLEEHRMLLDALCQISLCANNSASTRDEMARIARDAVTKARKT